MIIVGIDPGLSHTGIAFFSAGGENLALLMQTISTRPEEPLHERLRKIHMVCAQLAPWAQPEAVAVELMMAGPANKKVIAEINMAIGSMVVAIQAPVFMYAVPTIKKVLTGNGRSKRGQVYREMEKFVSIPRAGEHALDALAVAVAHWLITTKGENPCSN